MADLFSLPNEIKLKICDSLVLIEAEELKKDVARREIMMHTDRVSAGPCRTAYRTLFALARTCHALHTVVVDASRKRAVWPFNRPISAFAHQATLDSTWHIGILVDDLSAEKLQYRVTDTGERSRGASGYNRGSAART
jgi:hypothetical protein